MNWQGDVVVVGVVVFFFILFGSFVFPVVVYYDRKKKLMCDKHDTPAVQILNFKTRCGIVFLY